MTEAGYAISARDYARLEAALLRIERKVDLSQRRRLPVHSGVWGGGNGFPYPTERVGIYTTTVQLTKADHERKIVFCDNSTDTPGLGPLGNVTITAAVAPSIGDIYHLFCMYESPYSVHLYPAPGQTIIIPTRQAPITYGDGYYIQMGDVGYITMTYMLILVCCAADTWIVWAATSCKANNA